MAKIKVKGLPGKHRVIEDLGYLSQSDAFGAAIRVDGALRVVVRAPAGSVWRLKAVPTLDALGEK